MFLKNSSILPYWGKVNEVKMGLNQLGMRNIVESLFATMLPGLNNVTSRIRYYSFYCWILKQFRENGAGEDEKYHINDFITFIRTSEYLLAVINYYGSNLQGIPGNSFVNNHIDDNVDSVNLSGAIITSNGSYRGSYWANRLGIFGQYYLNSIMDLALIGRIEADMEYFYGVRTDGGEQFIDGESLADAFALGIGEDGDAFLSCVRNGVVLKKVAKRLSSSFDMHSFASSETERNLVMDCLLQRDFPSAYERESAHRRRTVRYVLDYFKTFPGREFNEQEFAFWMYGKYQLASSPDSTITGWYAYYLEESWQYLSSIVFTHVLNSIADDGWRRVSDLADSITSEVRNFVCGSPDASVNLATALNSLPDVGDAKSAGEAFARIMKLFLENRDNMDVVQKTAGLAVLYAEGPDDMFAFFRKMEESQESDFGSFVRDYILEKIIYRHYQIAFVKQRLTGIASQKFVIERGCIKKVMGYDYSHTSPRLGTLIEFLRDLGAVEGNKISTYGEHILTRIEHEDRA